jgi:GH35 family endo-1,4-beta-xylanase
MKPAMHRRRLLQWIGSLTVASALPLRGLARLAEEPAPGTSRYEGMGSSALWRTQAHERIEKLRKANFRIAVLDNQGNPLPNAEVRLSQYRHHFGFGAAVKPEYLFEQGSPEHQAFYRDTTNRYFHRTTVANGLKWKHHEAKKPAVEKFLDWCRLQQMPVRGHCLVWPRFRRIPARLGHLRDDRPALRKTIEEHVTKMVSMYDEPLIEWDVLNEPFTEHEFMDLLGQEVVHDWFRLAEKANPRLTRYINDFGVLTRPSVKHQQFYFDMIRDLLDANVPVQGIGFQGHIPRRFAPTPPAELLRTMDWFATLGLPLQVTEFDFETTDQELQARYTSDFLVAVFSHPAMTGLVTWTPFEYANGQVSKPDAALFDRHRREKPNGHVWNTLVNQTWHTGVKLTTDAHGVAEFRGFKGRYNVEATLGSAHHTQQASLIEDNGQATVTL